MMEIKLPFTPEIAERFDGLYQYLFHKYRINQVPLKISDYQFKIFSVGNLDDLLDDLLDELASADPSDFRVKDEQLPYWAEIWPSSLALSEYILQNKPIRSGSRVLEIGCGLGIAGMCAGVLNADVLMTDYQEDALRFSELNWMINLGRVPGLALLDWRSPDLPYKFDVILASDVAYEKRNFYPLMEVFDKLLKPKGEVLLGEPNRPIARDFFELLKEEGYVLHKVNIEYKFNRQLHNVSVYRIRNQT